MTVQRAPIFDSSDSRGLSGAADGVGGFAGKASGSIGWVGNSTGSTGSGSAVGSSGPTGAAASTGAFGPNASPKEGRAGAVADSGMEMPSAVGAVIPRKRLERGKTPLQIVGAPNSRATR